MRKYIWLKLYIILYLYKEEDSFILDSWNFV